MKKAIHYFIAIVAILVLSEAFAIVHPSKNNKNSSGDLKECSKKFASKWAINYSQCPNSTNSYTVILKNICNENIDILCAVEEVSKEWKMFFKKNVAPYDTIIGFACNSTGNYKSWVRKAGEKSALPTYNEINAAYLEEAKKMSPIAANDEELIDIFAKLLYGETKQEPLINQQVSLKDEHGDRIQTSTTDEFGDFSFKKVNPKQKLEIVLETNISLPANEKVYLAQRNGTVIKAFDRSGEHSFKFELIPSNRAALTKIKDEEDPFLGLFMFKKSDQKDFIVNDIIYYNEGSSEVLPEAANKLDKVVDILKNNSIFLVEIISHTDAKGDDASNMKLSEERAKLAVQYIVSKGIDAKRILGKGMGEMVIINKCKNGVDCSEEEHRVNRRTEYKFIKN